MPGAKPIPVRVITGTLPRASLVMVTPPVLKPAVVGLKVTLMVQPAPTATFVPQLFVWAKSPLAAMLVMFNTAVPLLVSVDVWGGLVVPMGWLPKFRLAVESVTRGPLTVVTSVSDDGRKKASLAKLAATVFGPSGWLTTMVQLAVPFELVVPVHDCAPVPLPSVKVSVRPEIGVVPSSLSEAEKVADCPLASTVGLVAVNLSVVSSSVTVNVVDAELP